MILLVYKEDLVDNPNLTIENIEIKHIKIGLYPVAVSDRVIFIDYNEDKFKILKDNFVPEISGIIIEDTEYIKNFL